MDLRVLTWNIRKAKSCSPAWHIISDINADILLLQEVISAPNFIKDNYSIIQKKAVCENGKKQAFSTAILVKGKVSEELHLKSNFDWVNRELEFFDGNLLAYKIHVEDKFPINVVSVYSPAWPVDKERLKDNDVSEVKLKLNPEVWCTEILWSALKSSNSIKSEPWIVAGDFNSSVTFDYLWEGGPRGNQEIVDRMNAIGFKECLYTHTGKLTPTFRNPKGGKLIHQLDHMYVTKPLLSSLTHSYVADNLCILEKSISDHLPIVSDFLITG